MAMAHSVEGRFPFLDHRVIEFCNQIPPHLKLRGLQEKHVLKKSMEGLLPAEVRRRPKRPYRAPISPSFFNPSTHAYVEECLSPESIRANGYFNPAAVSRLADKCRQETRLGENDSMALAGILSLQLLHHLFVDYFVLSPIPDIGPVKMCVG